MDLGFFPHHDGARGTEKTPKELGYSSYMGTRYLSHPNINILILHSVLYTFPKLPTRRICLTIKSIFSW